MSDVTHMGNRGRRLIGAAPVLLALMVAVAGCGSSGTINPTTSSGATQAPSPAVSPTQPGSTTLDGCTLLTATDASTLNGSTMTLQHDSGGDCTYAGSGGPGVSGVEITVKADPDADTAHAEFPRWVQPVAGALPPGFTITPESGVGDEASETHSGTVLDGIFFRHGDVLIKIGCYPPANDAALKAAANTVLGRL